MVDEHIDRYDMWAKVIEEVKALSTSIEECEKMKRAAQNKELEGVNKLSKSDEEIIAIIRTYVGMLSENGRESLFSVLDDEYCIHCGITQEKYRCQCWNDD